MKIYESEELLRAEREIKREAEKNFTKSKEALISEGEKIAENPSLNIIKRKLSQKRLHKLSREFSRWANIHEAMKVLWVENPNLQIPRYSVDGMGYLQRGEKGKVYVRFAEVKDEQFKKELKERFYPAITLIEGRAQKIALQSYIPQRPTPYS